MSCVKSKAELVELVRKIMDCEGSEDEINNWLLELKASVHHPAVSDLIFYPEDDDITPEQVVEEALSYKPMSLE
ncbi:MAG: bacteriocin immunity protein [Sedimenticola sp.]|nr:bacteriocin immunity protein [Sedimenticola sp.]